MGIDYSFGSETGQVVEVAVGYQEVGCFVVEFQRQCSEECQQGFLEACLVVVDPVVDGRLRQKQRQNRDRQ